MTAVRRTTADPKIAKSKNLREKIYDMYRERIATGQIAHEDRMVDVEIAAQLNISRMPVREALMQLVNEGMLESTSRGFVLRRFSDDEIEDIFEIRKLLEPVAAANAASNMTTAALQRMERALEDCRRAGRNGEFSRFISSNAEFRGVWLEQVTNRQLAASIKNHVDHVQAVRLATLKRKEIRKDVLDKMQQLYLAFRALDASKASAVIESALAAALSAFRFERLHAQSAGERKAS
jgi:DNA-binding GntR family transcriptional regulator